MDIQLYLDKLKVQPREPNLEFLNELISAHQRTISFNNLAVYFRPGRILNLEIEPLFEKVIVRKEGGYCFENNKVFFYLLKGLGFEVHPRAARVIYDKTGDVPRTHRTTVVTIDGKRYLADVGFGRDVPPRAIPIGETQKSGHQVIQQDGLYLHQFHKGDATINLYTFDDGHYQESDFNISNYYTNTHPDSKFVKELMVIRKDPEALEIINGKIYSIIKNENRENFEIRNQAEFEFYLSKFGITERFDFSLIK